MVDFEPPRWDRSLREVGLVALQASVLTRRIFLPAAGRDDRAPEQWQLLLALALTDTAPYEVSAPSLESLAVQLSLDREYAHELLYALMSADLVVAANELDDDTSRFRRATDGLSPTAARR